MLSVVSPFKSKSNFPEKAPESTATTKQRVFKFPMLEKISIVKISMHNCKTEFVKYVVMENPVFNGASSHFYEVREFEARV